MDGPRLRIRPCRKRIDASNGRPNGIRRDRPERAASGRAVRNRLAVRKLVDRGKPYANAGIRLYKITVPTPKGTEITLLLDAQGTVMDLVERNAGSSVP